jgi:hypothetical protein
MAVIVTRIREWSCVTTLLSCGHECSDTAALGLASASELATFLILSLIIILFMPLLFFILLPSLAFDYDIALVTIWLNV